MSEESQRKQTEQAELTRRCYLTGGIGQPLSLLLKQNPLVTKLTLFDIRGCPGVAADIAHVNTPAEVRSLPAAQRSPRRLRWIGQYVAVSAVTQWTALGSRSDGGQIVAHLVLVGRTLRSFCGAA